MLGTFFATLFFFKLYPYVYFFPSTIEKRLLNRLDFSFLHLFFRNDYHFGADVSQSRYKSSRAKKEANESPIS